MAAPAAAVAAPVGGCAPAGAASGWLREQATVDQSRGTTDAFQMKVRRVDTISLSDSEPADVSPDLDDA
jgi:hypothetical protein